MVYTDLMQSVHTQHRDVISNDLIGIVEPVRAITVHVHGRFLSDILIQLCDMINTATMT